MNDKRFWKITGSFFYRAFLTLCFLVVLSGCRNDSQWYGKAIEKDMLIKTDYPELYSAYKDRDIDKLLSFTDHDNESIRQQAWKGLIHTDVKPDDEFFENVISADIEEAWLALGFRDHEAERLTEVHLMWSEGSINRSAACRYLSEAGNEETIRILLNEDELLIRDQNCAQAVGRIVSGESVEEDLLYRVAEISFEPHHLPQKKRFLYGFYRSTLNRPVPNSNLYNFLKNRWFQFGVGLSPGMDQYMARILGGEAVFTILESWDERELNKHVQLPIELAGLLSEIELNDETVEQIKKLLRHGNPHVTIRALEAISSYSAITDELREYISRSIASATRNAEVLISAVKTLYEIDGSYENHLERMSLLAAENPYLTGQLLEVYGMVEENNEFLERLTQLTDSQPIAKLHTMRALVGLWQKSGQDSAALGRMREIFWSTAEGGGPAIFYNAEPLLKDRDFMEDSDYSRLEAYVSQYSVTRELEFYKMMTEVFHERFPEQSAVFLDSIADTGFVPLNSHLAGLGVENVSPGSVDVEFREPDWELLYEIGTHPHWVLETDYGRIEVSMNPKSAPGTVSAIDSLTRAGAYNDVPFHRVVPNFVIQGGDVQYRNGFGGPSYNLPTEPSTDSFERSMAGIASRGPDSEGSQYFFMHQWAPHLDGGYTLFGKVVRGMDIVDRIQVVDKVNRAYISLR